MKLKKVMALSAMGGYWRCCAVSLLPKDLDPIPGPELNWETICLELERLDEVNGVFCNRRWVLENLEDLEVNLQQLILHQMVMP